MRSFASHRLYSKGRARRHQKGANLQLPNAKKNNEAHRKEHRKKQHQDSGSTHTKREHSSARRRSHRELSKKKKKQQAWNQINFELSEDWVQKVPKKLPPRMVAKHRAKIAKAQRVQALLQEEGTIIPSPPSRCVNNKRFFGKDFDANAHERKTNKPIMYSGSESSYAIESAASKRRPNSGLNKKLTMRRKSITRSCSTRTNRTGYALPEGRAISASPTKVKRKSIIDNSQPRLSLINPDQIESHVDVCIWMNRVALDTFVAKLAINPIVR